MHGRTPWLIALLPLLVLGCAETSDRVPQSPPPQPEVASQFDPASTATITGRVLWLGPRPVVAPFRSTPLPLTDQAPPPPALDWPNPNAPRINAAGVSSAVVFLRGVDLRRARPWDHPHTTVELRQPRFLVRQGASDGNIGFVRAGDKVDLVSRHKCFHSIQARGASFFARALADPDEVRSCALDSPGVVELTSGCGYFWMRAYLLVDHHPYYARPDAKGNFRLEGVPPGEYDLVAWHPNWVVQREERNPDSFRVQQVRFGAPVEVVRRVVVRPGDVLEADLGMSAALAFPGETRRATVR